ncbi:hypothetical protein Leryth_023110 [Lithospermum erythrorhizon]|nr:hypothetical protein Leryth_023110 [Lithospermum erythrorhizon]
MMNQPVAGNQDPVVKAFVGNEFGDEIFPISENKPFFDIVLAKRNVKPLYRMEFPEEICPLLPSTKVPAVLTCNSKTWETTLIGDRECKKFERDSWRKFVTDNNLKFDDCLVFQIMERCTDEIKFAVQILRGEFPSELEDLVAANTVNID